MHNRERIVLGSSAALFLVVAVALAVFLPSERHTEPLLIAALVAGHALVSRVRFEFGNGYVTTGQLTFVPLLLLTPLPYVPLLTSLSVVISVLPDLMSGQWHRGRWLGSIADSWFSVGPVILLAALAPGAPQLGSAGIYILAFIAQYPGDLAWSVVRDRLIDGVEPRETMGNWLGAMRVEAVLSPVAFFITLGATQHPLALLSIPPLVWLLRFFSREREQRYHATLELHRAYRGTVMLLSDVVEFDDAYTAEHSRSIVDLAHAVADELGMDAQDFQELEFAALLHDVGKIAIPKEILNKPSSLTDEEFEVMKTHTIEGQFMLDRVGGLLGRVGEIVRSCHERWDGSGYPDALSGETIPLASRIVFVCDAYNAMTTDRVYRSALSQEEALAELDCNAGTQFDPRLVAALFRVLEREQPAFSGTDEVRAVLAGATASRLRATA
jgi:HD-GYP domain-containing protein (c-di-GMP phosphodiesterase class II)